MKLPTALTPALIALAVTLATAGADASEVTSLRGPTAVPESTTPPPLAEPEPSDQRIPRAFREQPPLIPHDIEGLAIRLGENACLECHERGSAADAGAPPAAESHYRDRAGKPLSSIARSRWFCNQCHVPQTGAAPLVRNEFAGSR